MGKLIPNAFNLIVVIAVALGSTACSYGMAVISSTIGQTQFYVDMNLAPQGDPDYPHTANMIGAMNGLNSAGSAFGAVLTTWSADKYGRLRSIQFGAVVLIVGAILCAAAVDLAMFLVARFIAGFGIGMLITAIPMYQAEVSTPESRGFMVSMHGIMFAMGYSLSAWIGFGCNFMTLSGSSSSFPWRFPLAFQTFPALLLLTASKWLPFSPRWLLQQNRGDEAHDVIRRLHHIPGDVHEELATKEFLQMKKQLELDRQIKANTSYLDLFKTPANRKRAWVGFSLMFGNQFTGVLVIANYGVLLYIALGMTTYMPLLLSALWVTASFPGNIFTAFYIDKWGRRTFLLTGLAGLTVTLIFECAMQASFLGTDNTAGQRAAIFFIFLFIFFWYVPFILAELEKLYDSKWFIAAKKLRGRFWSTFLDASQFVYLAEIYPTHLRSAGVGLGMVGLYLASIVLLVAGPIALEKITWKFFIVLIVPTFLHMLNVYFFFPETKQRSLEDINAQFGEEVAVRFYGATEDDERAYAKAIEEEDKAQGLRQSITNDAEKTTVAHVSKA